MSGYGDDPVARLAEQQRRTRAQAVAEHAAGARVLREEEASRLLRDDLPAARRAAAIAEAAWQDAVAAGTDPEAAGEHRAALSRAQDLVASLLRRLDALGVAA